MGKHFIETKQPPAKSRWVSEITTESRDTRRLTTCFTVQFQNFSEFQVQNDAPDTV
jgi:hypothetical protein